MIPSCKIEHRKSGNPNLFYIFILKESKEENRMSTTKIFQSLKKTFKSGKTLSLEWRLSQLYAIKKLLVENEDAVSKALNSDLGRCNFESVGCDVLPCYPEVDLAISKLKTWMKPVHSPVPMIMSPAVCEEQSRPLGVVFIIGPFNYPFTLCIQPLIGAIAAGCCVLVKPSEACTEIEKLLVDLFSKYLDSECIKIITGDYKVSAELTKLPWNKIFFTGSTRVGKIISAAAAENLTPVCLELGGKTPVIVDNTVTDLTLASKRIVWGRLLNNGQTCIACDYVLVHQSVHDEFVQACSDRIKEFYGEDPSTCDDYGRLVNNASAARLKKLMTDCEKFKGCKGKIQYYPVGQSGPKFVNEKDCYVPPTLVTGITTECPLMQEEIFGPILPIMPFSSLEEVVDITNTEITQQPLALYIFSKDKTSIDYLINNIHSGGVVVNDTVFGVASPNLPFGGVGPSGIGSYHGKASFDCFSHSQPIVRRHDLWWLDVPFRFPPYSNFGLNVFKLAFGLPDQPSVSRYAFSRTIILGAVGCLLYYAFPLYFKDSIDVAKVISAFKS